MSDADSFTLPDSKLDVLREHWVRLTAKASTEQSERTFHELHGLYSSPRRAYHNLSHVNALLEQSIPLEERMQNPAAVRFAIWFHDAVYETSRKDNEERSAEMAQTSMIALDESADIIAIVQTWILATKTHRTENLNDDGKLFLDLDLSILGAGEEIYRIYTRAIRKEYWWVPKMIYTRERKKVLENFLRRDRIYSTPVIFDTREAQARRNIEAELALY